jgi:preprotein translocase subunit SecE
VGGVLGWPGRKLGEARAFLQEVRGELKKVTWPSRKEVYSTTLVVIATSIFFGFYLWGLDIVFSRALSLAFKRQF